MKQDRFGGVLHLYYVFGLEFASQQFVVDDTNEHIREQMGMYLAPPKKLHFSTIKSKENKRGTFHLSVSYGLHSWGWD